MPQTGQHGRRQQEELVLWHVLRRIRYVQDKMGIDTCNRCADRTFAPWRRPLPSPAQRLNPTLAPDLRKSGPIATPATHCRPGAGPSESGPTAAPNWSSPVADPREAGPDAASAHTRPALRLRSLKSAPIAASITYSRPGAGPFGVRPNGCAKLDQLCPWRSPKIPKSAVRHKLTATVANVVNPHVFEIGSQLCIYCHSLEFTSSQKHVLRQSDRTGHIMVFTFYPSFCRTGIARHAFIWGPRPRQHHRDLEIGRQLCIQDVAQEDEDIEPP